MELKEINSLVELFFKKCEQLNSDNLTRLGKLQNFLTENYDINVKKVLPKQKLEQAYQNVEKRLVNLRNKNLGT